MVVAQVVLALFYEVSFDQPVFFVLRRFITGMESDEMLLENDYRVGGDASCGSVDVYPVDVNCDRIRHR